MGELARFHQLIHVGKHGAEIGAAEPFKLQVFQIRIDVSPISNANHILDLRVALDQIDIELIGKKTRFLQDIVRALHEREHRLALRGRRGVDSNREISYAAVVGIFQRLYKRHVPEHVQPVAVIHVVEFFVVYGKLLVSGDEPTKKLPVVHTLDVRTLERQGKLAAVRAPQLREIIERHVCAQRNLTPFLAHRFIEEIVRHRAFALLRLRPSRRHQVGRRNAPVSASIVHIA